MGKINNLTDFLTDVADAIREKKGTTDLINPQDFSDEIRNIESGGIINESELPLYMEADSSFNVKFVGNDIQYSFDNKSWNNVVSDTFISIELEQRVYFRAFNLVPNSTNGIGNFATDAEYKTNFKVGGNIMSMLMGVDTSDNTVAPENAFRQIFAYSRIADAENLCLPADTIGRSAYYGMFRGCARLVKVPKLPAKNIDYMGYARMFSECESLIFAPELPAVNLMGNYCYQNMFVDSVALKYGPSILPAMNLTKGCYSYMFSGCENLIVAPKLPATQLSEACYQCMFQKCFVLESSPHLLASTLVTKCYDNMFNQCRSIRLITTGFITAPSSSYTANWVYDAPSNGIFIKSKNATWSNSFGIDAIPTGWTVVTV